jgi:uncharacterized protein YdeI (YjbR/CyaY-like superfamily)
MAKTKIDRYFSDATTWREEAERLREVLLGCGLTEEMKWGQPCYTFEGKNVVLIQRMKEFLALLFFKGGALNDPDGILELPGPNSRVGRRIRFTGVQGVVDMEASVKALVRQAIEAEKSGLKVEVQTELDIPEELRNRFDEDPELKAAFEALTPGRQRAYGLYLSQAKQSRTRSARIEKYRQKILDGKGPNDR